MLGTGGISLIVLSDAYARPRVLKVVKSRRLGRSTRGLQGRVVQELANQTLYCVHARITAQADTSAIL
jgi:hypothetical protein